MYSEVNSNVNRIYMLELMIDKIILGYCVREEYKGVCGQMCVSFKFLDHGPFKICEGDFKPKRRNYLDLCPNPCFKNGKSCVFTLCDDKAREVGDYFMLELEVFIKLDDCCIPDTVMLGNLAIRLDPLFRDLRAKMQEELLQPMHCKTIQDNFAIYGACTNDIIGELHAFIRLTCFGKMVINDFQMDMATRELGLKEEGGYVFKFLQD